MSVSRIAEISGVSKATVSRVLNGRPGVHANNVKAVMEAARQIDYATPDKTVSKTKGGGRSTVTVAYLRTDKELMTNYADTGRLVYEGLAAAAAEQGVDLICGSASSVDRLPEVVRSGRADGLIMAGMSPSPAISDRLKALPQVWVTSFRTADDVYVLPGNEQVGAMALEYLRQRGHQRLAVVNAFAHHPAMASRSMFFEFSARQRGLSVASYVAEQAAGPSSEPEYWNQLEASLDRLMEELAATDDRPTAVFVPGTSSIAMAYRAAQRLGLMPGRDLDFVTCGGEVEVMTLHPRPGIVDISPQEMGRRAVRILMSKLQNPDVRHGTIAVEPRLVAGEPLRD